MQIREPINQRNLTPKSQQVLGYLFSQAEADGTCAFTRHALAKALRVSESTVKRALREAQHAAG